MPSRPSCSRKPWISAIGTNFGLLHAFAHGQIAVNIRRKTAPPQHTTAHPSRRTGGHLGHNTNGNISVGLLRSVSDIFLHGSDEADGADNSV
eukprot:scaffold309685_cov33-Tisochrysis_lutea.AAC.1